MVQIMQLVKDNRQDILDDFNQYNVDNAWFDVSYGGCQCGIFSAVCPIEPLHALENGIIPDCLMFLYWSNPVSQVLRAMAVKRTTRGRSNFGELMTVKIS
jgi:hypothetical protein